MFTIATAATAIALTMSCSVTDGDTIRCGDERIRITGIDAPETRACRKGRTCVPGDGDASTRTMEDRVNGAQLTIVRLGQDRYGRTLGVIYADGVNVACAQLEARQAYYIERWDDKGLVAADCPRLAAERMI
ncbi:thermonuclease family protein [Aurantiacibacter rhizosphaerae]|uniref:Thermonuclease family protein n=1 Tax=Aurantiacibacter rhizosphaerae TaxID=2691582 RepID=A0A844XI60_9SPHN|nr:thermonuclease family protein [Aurantiacibacter rhizosphaerae]MWV29403.1 thermonuclease family protein [Aurantiacibacter rhizosphaerae]